ncbi:MAG: 4'-phosphopantetheinyl transferase superfamily protein [Candidatus Nitrotoga sp.]
MQKMLPAQISLVKATPTMWCSRVFSEEETLIEHALEKRKREFRAGRNSAHRAIRQLGLKAEPIMSGQHREPVWPPGIVGSLSHTENYCIAACCRSNAGIRMLGVDVERNLPLGDDLWSYVHTPSETVLLKSRSDLPQRIVFSAKESLFKCIYPFLGRYFGFHDVELSLDQKTQRFDYAPTDAGKTKVPRLDGFAGYYVFDEAHVLTVCCICPDSVSSEQK